MRPHRQHNDDYNTHRGGVDQFSDLPGHRRDRERDRDYSNFSYHNGARPDLSRQSSHHQEQLDNVPRPMVHQGRMQLLQQAQSHDPHPTAHPTRQPLNKRTSASTYLATRGDHRDDRNDRNDRNDRRDDRPDDRRDDRYLDRSKTSSIPTARSAPLPHTSVPHQPQADANLVVASRLHRRLYVGNLPRLLQPLSDQVVRIFFTKYLLALGFTTPDPIIGVQMQSLREDQSGTSQGFCFVEFRSVRDADAALYFMGDGKSSMGPNVLRISRPKGFTGIPTDFVDIVVGHPNGSHLPPPGYIPQFATLPPHGSIQTSQTNRPTSLAEDMFSDSMLSQTKYSTTSSEFGEMTTDEYKVIEAIPKATVNAAVAKFFPLLQPLGEINNRLLQQQTDDAVYTKPTIVHITNLIHQNDHKKLADDIEWLNIADEICDFIDSELASILEGDPGAQDGFFTDILIPRPVMTSTTPGMPLTEPNFDRTTGVYHYTPVSKEHRDMDGMNDDGIKLAPKTPPRRIIGCCNPAAKELIGHCFIVCRSNSIARLLYELLSKVCYFKQLLYLRFDSQQTIQQIFDFLALLEKQKQDAILEQKSIEQNLISQNQHDYDQYAHLDDDVDQL